MLDSFPPRLRDRIGIPENPDSRSRSGSDRVVTLLQLSTTFCSPCRHTRILLDDLATRTDGVRHVEIDLTHHPEWSTPLNVHQTPTTLALDADGTELFRVRGVPRRTELTETLRPHLPESASDES